MTVGARDAAFTPCCSRWRFMNSRIRSKSSCTRRSVSPGAVGLGGLTIPPWAGAAGRLESPASTAATVCRPFWCQFFKMEFI